MSTFLRQPKGPAEVLADAVRILGALSIIVAGMGWGPLAAVTVALTSFGTLIPRFVGVRPGFDIAFALVVLVAGWSSVLEIYLTARWWDIPIHFAATGLAAALLYLLLTQRRILSDAASAPRPAATAVVVTTALGLSLSVVWEVAEWFGHTFIDEEIYVGYADSIGDLVAGGLGALIAGASMRVLSAHSRAVPAAIE